MARPTIVYEPPALRRVRPIAALRRMRQFRDLFLTLSLHRIKVRYRQSKLGFLWAIIQPLGLMLVFSLMFVFLRTRAAADVPFPLFAYAALVPWTGFASGLSSASGALTSNASLVTKVNFPREILPLTYVVAALVDMAVATVILVALMAWYGIAPTAAIVWAVPALVLLTGLLVGLGLLLSAIQVQFRDVGLAIPVLVQIWLFATPVFYPLAAVKDALSPRLYTLYTLNPMAGVIDTFRRAMVLGQGPDTGGLAVSAAVVVVLVPAAYMYFKYVELTMADVV